MMQKNRFLKGLKLELRTTAYTEKWGFSKMQSKKFILFAVLLLSFAVLYKILETVLGTLWNIHKENKKEFQRINEERPGEYFDEP